MHGLIREIHAHTGQRVVVLVDEYDKPILDNITAPDIAREMRDGLRNLYSVLKGADPHLRFVLLTGVSRTDESMVLSLRFSQQAKEAAAEHRTLSKVSLFSGLNNLEDITLSARYSAICGYTEVDLDTVFSPELDGLDREEIRRWSGRSRYVVTVHPSLPEATGYPIT